MELTLENVMAKTNDKNWERSNLKEIVRSFIDRVAELEAEIETLAIEDDKLNAQLMKDIADLTESNQQYQKQVEDANLDNIARRKEIVNLKSHIELHAGDCCSLRNEADMFRERAEAAEKELLASKREANDLRMLLM